MGINGRLTNKNLERKIKDMEVGEEGFAVPWALGFNEYKIPYLNVEFSIGKSPYGSRSMPIKRIGRGLADYDINLEFDYFSRSLHSKRSRCLGFGRARAERSLPDTWCMPRPSIDRASPWWKDHSSASVDAWEDRSDIAR